MNHEFVKPDERNPGDGCVLVSETGSPLFCLGAGDWIALRRAVRRAAGVPESEMPFLYRELLERPCLFAAALLGYWKSTGRASLSLEQTSLWLARLSGSAMEVKPLSGNHELVVHFERQISRLRGKSFRRWFVRRNGNRWRLKRFVEQAIRVVELGVVRSDCRKLRREVMSSELTRQILKIGRNRSRATFWNRPQGAKWNSLESSDLLSLIESDLRRQAMEADFASQLHAQKLASLRQLAYGASHEINNPLANIAMRAQSMQAAESDSKRLKNLQAIYNQAMRAHQMITDLMLFANPPEVHLQLNSPADITAKVLSEVLQNYPQRDFRVTMIRSGQPGGWMTDAIQFAEMIGALLRNSIESIGVGGRIELAVIEDPGRQLTVRVADNGRGIPPEFRPHIFDPFFSGREAGRGLGFGLSRSWVIARNHGGDLKCVSGEPGATVFEFTLPLAGRGIEQSGNAAGEETTVGNRQPGFYAA